MTGTTQNQAPLSYMGVRSINPGNVIVATSAPTAATPGNLGDQVVNTTDASVYELAGISGSTYTWVGLGGGAAGIDTINTNAPIGGNYTLAGTANQIAKADTAGTTTFSLVGPYTPATYTAHGVLIGEGTSSIAALAAAATGTVLAGVTGADPAFTATPSVTTLTATTVHGTTIDTNIAAAQLSLNGTTMTATGSNTDVSMNLATKGTGSLVMARSAAGVDLNMQITNSDNTATSSPAGLQLAVGGATNTGDPYVNFLVSGAGVYTMGIDNSVSDNFVLAASAALGTSNIASWTSAGALTNAAGISATTGNIAAAAGAVTAATTMTATLGAITATNGNFTGSTAGTGFLFNANTATSGTGTVVLASRAGAAVFTSVSIAGGADSTLTITNSAITGASTQVIYSLSGVTTGAALSIKSVTNSAGSSAVVVTNGTALTTSTADITLTFLVVN